MPADLLKLGLAAAAGGLIGAEREFRDRAAGFRTIIFICVGAVFFTIVSHKIALAHDRDPTRIAANIVSGVGFLGAGVILRDGGRVMGLTTAAIIWVAAALGIGFGAGQHGLAAAGGCAPAGRTRGTLLRAAPGTEGVGTLSRIVSAHVERSAAATGIPLLVHEIARPSHRFGNRRPGPVELRHRRPTNAVLRRTPRGRMMPPATRRLTGEPARRARRIQQRE